jgi:hypothetical protein
MVKRRLVLALGAVLVVTGPASADLWDVATHNDNSADSTLNELVHGSVQVHDLGDIVADTTPDEDWYQILGGPYSSYEAVVDGITGDLPYDGGTGGVVIERTTFQGILLQTGVQVGVGPVQHVAWDDSALPALGRLRVYSLGCPGCTTEDQYRIQFFDTTCVIPRFNNSATQVTVMVLQNAAPSYGVPPVTNVTGHYWLLSASGVVLNPGSNTYSMAPGGTFVRNTLADAPGGSGSIVITNDSGYGAVTGKAVAVEPATGFTFDTALTCRPH